MSNNQKYLDIHNFNIDTFLNRYKKTNIMSVIPDYKKIFKY